MACLTGNYDLVGLNFPVFFVRDPFMGPDNIRYDDFSHFCTLVGRYCQVTAA